MGNWKYLGSVTGIIIWVTYNLPAQEPLGIPSHRCHTVERLCSLQNLPCSYKKDFQPWQQPSRILSLWEVRTEKLDRGRNVQFFFSSSQKKSSKKGLEHIRKFELVGQQDFWFIMHVLREISTGKDLKAGRCCLSVSKEGLTKRLAPVNAALLNLHVSALIILPHPSLLYNHSDRSWS